MFPGSSLALEFRLLLVKADWSEEWLEMGEEVLIRNPQVPVQEEEELLLHEIDLSN